MQLLGNFLAVPKAFPNPVDWNKIQACTWKSDEYVYDYYNQLQIVSKKNSGLPSDVDNTAVVFNYMFTNGLNWILLVKRIRMKWETVHSRFS